MANEHPSPVTHVAGHPVHGVLAAYPLAFFTGAFVTDVIYVNTAQFMWANFSIWLITAGLITGALAGVAGVVDFVVTKPASRVRPGWVHSIGTGLMLVLSLFNAFVHSRDGWNSVMPAGIILSGIVTMLAVVTSWNGFQLIYCHRVGAA